MLWWPVYNIPDSGVSEYSITDTSNSSVSKYYVTKQRMIFLTLTLVNKLIKEIEIKAFIVFIFFRK